MKSQSIRKLQFGTRVATVSGGISIPVQHLACTFAFGPSQTYKSDVDLLVFWRVKGVANYMGQSAKLVIIFVWACHEPKTLDEIRITNSQ